MKIKPRKTKTGSILLRVTVKGTSYSHTFGRWDDPEDFALANLVAWQAVKKIANGEFTGFKPWFKSSPNKFHTKETILKELSELRTNTNLRSLVSHLRKYAGRMNTKEDVLKFFEQLNTTEPTKARYLSELKRVAPKLCEGLNFKQSQGDPDIFTDWELKQLYKDPTIGLLAEFWAEFGLRPGELAALEWGDFNWEKNYLKVWQSYSRETKENKCTKTGKERIIPFPKDSLVIEVLRSLLPDYFMNIHVFPELRQQQNFINRKWKPVLKKIGIRYRKPYALRQTCATNKIAQYKGDLSRVAYEMGHSVQVLSEFYAGYINLLKTED